MACGLSSVRVLFVYFYGGGKARVVAKSTYDPPTTPPPPPCWIQTSQPEVAGDLLRDASGAPLVSARLP